MPANQALLLDELEAGRARGSKPRTSDEARARRWRAWSHSAIQRALGCAASSSPRGDAGCRTPTPISGRTSRPVRIQEPNISGTPPTRYQVTRARRRRAASRRRSDRYSPICKRTTLRVDVEHARRNAVGPEPVDDALVAALPEQVGRAQNAGRTKTGNRRARRSTTCCRGSGRAPGGVGERASARPS